MLVAAQEIEREEHRQERRLVAKDCRVQKSSAAKSFFNSSIRCSTAARPLSRRHTSSAASSVLVTHTRNV